MCALLGKEFRSLRPIILLALFMALMDDFHTAFTGFPDQKGISTTFDPNSAASDLTIEMMVIGLLLAAGLLVRESDDGTLHFLDGLPVSRARIFTAKVIAAAAVLVGVLVVEIGGAVLFHALSRNSHDGAFPWPMAATGFALNLLAGLAVFSVGLALSFLRRWVFLFLGLFVWVFFLAKDFRVPHIGLLNPLELTRPVFDEGRWLIPQTRVAAQLVVAVAGLGLALIGFRLTGDRSRRMADRLRRTRSGKALTALAIVAIPGVWLSLLIRAGKDAASEAAATAVVEPSDKTVEHATAHFAFVYRESQAAEALALIGEAEAVHEKVVRALHADPIAGPIAVETTSAIQRHNAGQAYWKKIRMNLPDDAEPGALAAVLGHEVVHVYLDQLSDLRLARLFNSVRFFHEGLASHIEHREFRTPDALRDFRRNAAVAHAWELASFETLVDDAALRRESDSALAYPLGEVFCAALVKVCGEAAPGQVARAFARTNAPKDLGGVTLWQDTLQACGFSLEAVLAEYRAELDRLVAAEREFIARLPRPRATVEASGETIVLRPAFDGPAHGELVCVTRAAKNATDLELDYWSPDESGAIRLPRTRYDAPTFWYQLGWQEPGARHPVLDRWVEAKTR